MLGPNGAGKTTTLRALSGMVRRAGTVSFDGEDVAGAAPEKMAQHSIAHVPEGRGTFTGLTVAENLQGRRLPAQGPRRDRRGRPALLRVLPAAGRAQGAARGLAQRRRAADAGRRPRDDAQAAADAARRAFARPGAQPHPRAVHDPRRIARDEGTTVLLVEQNASLALKFADYAYVLEAGQIALSGDGRRARPRTRHATLVPGGLMARVR